MVKNKTIELRIDLNNRQRVDLNIDTAQQSVLSLGTTIPVPIRDYNQLINKPSVNGRTLMGDMDISWLLQDGLIIDGGNASGYSSTSSSEGGDAL